MTTSERGAVRFGRSSIGYAVERSARRQTLTIAVDLRGGVTVQAPRETPAETIAAAVRRKAPWVLRQLADLAELPPAPPPKEFVNGETFLYLGRGYRLKVVPRAGCATPDVKLWGGRLHVTVPAGVAGANRDRLVREALVGWYKGHARRRLPERVALFAGRLGDASPAVLVRDPAKRWGSCSRKGELRFSWRIMLAPLPLVDYVVAHEVCHLKLRNHSAAFWRLLRQLLPDYERRRQRLRVLGVQFQF
jgi:predicted metal-dependent hydrolase